MNPYLLVSIPYGPVVVRQVMACILEALWDKARVAGRFTPREVCAHLADWEPIFLSRMQLANATSGAPIEPMEEAEMAVTNAYAETDPLEQCALYATRRAQTASWLGGVTTAAWSHTVVHPQQGVQSLADLANMLLGHDLYHIEQLTAYVGT